MTIKKSETTENQSFRLLTCCLTRNRTRILGTKNRCTSHYTIRQYHNTLSVLRCKGTTFFVTDQIFSHFFVVKFHIRQKSSIFATVFQQRSTDFFCKIYLGYWIVQTVRLSAYEKDEICIVAPGTGQIFACIDDD